MRLEELREQFERTKKIYESAKIKFIGVEGFDVYNPSVPFLWHGKNYIYGRVEKREEWGRSWVRLFENTGKDEWTLVPDSMIYQLEDPYVSVIGDKLVMGGTHVLFYTPDKFKFYGYFYRGTDLDNMYYFTTGPDNMKDIRLVEMSDGRVGVFSRPRASSTSECQIGFIIIDSLDVLTPDLIENAPYIPGLFGDGEWGGCNQVYCLDSGKIGIIGHACYRMSSDKEVGVYLSMSFVFDPVEHKAMDFKIIGTRPCYPDGPKKVPSMWDVTFTSGIVMRNDARVDLYSGLNDCEVGRIVIDYPFEGYGKILNRGQKNETGSV